MTKLDWVKGDLLSASIPAHDEALRQGGETFLTEAFRAAGTLTDDNRVARITRLEDCPGGSTGRKLLLSVEYQVASPKLHTDLFVKFSRDFDDPIRDQAKRQLDPEVRLGLLSRTPGFPIKVPACYFADYHQASGTGILITQRIPFGTNGIEPLYEKCRDYEVPDILEHYRTIVKALGKLAGTQKAGKLGNDIDRHFPFMVDRQSLAQPVRYSLQQLQRRIQRYADFASVYTRLLPEAVATPEFIERMKLDLPILLDGETRIKHYLHGQPDYIALIHWNANMDNAWFWRNSHGHLECGLMDWGGVSQMNIGLALWGALSAAETNLWNDHLHELLTLFTAEFKSAGGPELDVAVLAHQLVLSATMMSLSWLMDAPAMILREIPDLDTVADRFDKRIKNNETARTQLQMMSNFLSLWEKTDVRRLLESLPAQ